MEIPPLAWEIFFASHSLSGSSGTCIYGRISTIIRCIAQPVKIGKIILLVATWRGVVCNALAESTIGLYETEVNWPRRPWKNIEEVDNATLERVGWFNSKRLLEPNGNIHRPTLRWHTMSDWRVS